ncbi:MAG: amidophosphoribosyltransferase [Clostridiales bacterium]|nr:amidophosphoribosyltransferase [Clostridiales bacterium]
MEQPEIEYCFDCSKGCNSYERGYPVFEYNEVIKKSIFRYKYGNRREYADFYCNEILNRYGLQLKQEKFDLIIPVPLSKKRMIKRGFNQSELLALRIAKYLNTKLDTTSLKRIIETKPQKILSSGQRQKNLKNAFQVRDNSVELKKILLVDDIYTTGSTVNACSKKLIEKGALSVHYISIAVGRGM